MSVTCWGWEEAAGGGDGRPPAQFLRQLPARRSNRPPRSPLFSSSLSLASPIYEATDPLFLPPWAITWRKCSDVVCEHVGLVGGFAALNKSFSSSPTVQKWRCNKDSKESMSFLIRCYCMWDCFSNGVSWPSMCFASVLPYMLTELTQLGKFARQMDNLPNTAGPNESSDTA